MQDLFTSAVERATALRRHLHQHPELTWEEHETAATIRRTLDDLGIRWRACAGTGTVATLAPDATGRHVALRADIDAMPVEEATGCAHASTVAGRMHACGHDGHTAALVAAAGWLRGNEGTLPGPVSLLFQPAEEGGHGAKAMIDDGAIEGVDVVFGWHNWPALPFGTAVCPDGTVMSGNGTFEILVRGEGGHASQPETTRDPVLAAAAITVALQQIVARRVAPQAAAVVAVTSIDAPSAPTVTPASAVVGGSIRFSDPGIRDDLRSMITEIADATALAHGVVAEVLHQPRYGPTVNHPGPAAEVRHALGELTAGDATISLPIMASEDFSYYLAEVPGAFALIGSDDGAPEHGVSCHSPHYDFNDALLPVVARLYTRLAGAPAPT